MMANRISYCFGITGPSYSIDSACSTGHHALVQASKMIHSGECDAAIIAGVNLCLNPFLSVQYFNLGMYFSQYMCIYMFLVIYVNE